MRPHENEPLCVSILGLMDDGSKGFSSGVTGALSLVSILGLMDDGSKGSALSTVHEANVLFQSLV